MRIRKQTAEENRSGALASELEGFAHVVRPEIAYQIDT